MWRKLLLINKLAEKIQEAEAEDSGGGDTEEDGEEDCTY